MKRGQVTIMRPLVGVGLIIDRRERHLNLD
jgi:hypothetical protein